MTRVVVEAPCRPTEDPAKVRQAVRNLFPDVEFQEDGEIRGTAASLDRLAELLRNQQIRGSAREVLLGSVRGNQLVFHLNKQAASAGKISFSAYAPLGDIVVCVEAEDAAQVVDRVAPAAGGGG